MQDKGPDRDQEPDPEQEASPPDAQTDEVVEVDKVDKGDEGDKVDKMWQADPTYPDGEDEPGASWLLMSSSSTTSARSGRTSTSRPVAASALVGTFVLGVVASLFVVLVWGMFTGDDAEGGSSDASLAGVSEPLRTGSIGTGTTEEGTTTPHEHAVPTRLSRCASASRTIVSALEAARPSLDQWAVHVGAMNKLVVGEITLQQATDFWERTRLGAQRRIADFRDAMTSLRRRGVDCPSSALLAPGARALPGCVRQVEAQVGAVRAATTSIDTWDQHVQHMDMMRLGQLSPEDATRMWLSMWQQGVRDLDAYKAAAREAGRLDGCDRIGSAR